MSVENNVLTDKFDPDVTRMVSTNKDTGIFAMVTAEFFSTKMFSASSWVHSLNKTSESFPLLVHLF